MRLLIFSFCLFSFSFAKAQDSISPNYLVKNGQDLNELHPDCGHYDNIHVQKLAHDSLSTGFLVWVKKSVRPHRHEFHSETVYVIEGEGEMVVDKDTFDIKAGSYVFIPTNKVHSVMVDETKGVMKVLSVQSPFFDGKDRVFIE